MEAAINWQSFFFLLFAAVACAFAVAVVISANIVRMAFYLILSLGATAGLFFLAGADFVGAMQLMIYVGGTLVLLVFGVMLTAQGPFISMKTRGGEWVMAAILGGSLLAVLVQRIVTVADWYRPDAVATTATTTTAATPPAGTAGQAMVLRDTRTATRIGMGLSGPRVDRLDQPDAALRAGMSSYLLPFEVISVHLLVVLIGAAYLARTKRRRLSNVLTEG
jgi:NADH-quinone oxidoreductase subunit J